MNTNTSTTGCTSDTVDAAINPLMVATIPAPVIPTGRAKVAIGAFDRDSDALLIVASLHIVNGMTGNPAYPIPDPSLADLVAARNEFIAAVHAAKGNTIGVVVRRQKRAALVALLRKLSHYVQVASGGDLAILLGSGFTAQRMRQPVGPLTAPANLRLLRGTATGEIVARCNKLPGAGAYEWRYAASAAPTAWSYTGSTLAASTTLRNLAAGTQYIAQVRAVGTTGPSNWSNAATLMAA